MTTSNFALPPQDDLSEPAVATTEFSNFPQLPPELRLKIWNLAARLPHNIEIIVSRYPIRHKTRPRIETGVPSKPAYMSFAYDFRSPTPPRPVLHACQESRNEYLRLKPDELGFTDRSRKITYFNEIDTLVVDIPTLFALWTLVKPPSRRPSRSPIAREQSGRQISGLAKGTPILLRDVDGEVRFFEDISALCTDGLRGGDIRDRLRVYREAILNQFASFVAERYPRSQDSALSGNVQDELRRRFARFLRDWIDGRYPWT